MALRPLLLGFAAAVFLFPAPAHGGLIIQRPVALGLDNGLVGHWTFDGQDMARTKAYDRSGQGNTGTLKNANNEGIGPTGTLGNIGQALSFDNVDDLVELSNSAALSPGDGHFTVSAWFYSLPGCTASGSADCHIYNDYGSLSVPAINLAIDDATKQLFVTFRDDGGDEVESLGGPILEDSRWHHAVGVRDSLTSATLYVDGVQVATASNGGLGTITTNTTIAPTIGALNTDGGIFTSHFSGTIDEVRVYNRALSPDEIKRLYKIGSTFTIGETNKHNLRDGLVGHWTFDGQDIAGNVAYDRSGQGNNGTLTGGPTKTIGKIGQAINFDGTNDEIVFGTTASINNLNFKTISAWIYPRTAGTNLIGIIVDRKGGTDFGWRFGICDDDTQGESCAADKVLFYQHGFTGGLAYGIWVTDPNTIKFNAWQHVVVTYASSTSAQDPTFYINGVVSPFTENQAPSGNPNPDTQNLVIGNRGGSDYPFDGSIDDVRIYNRALTRDEIKRLYKLGATATINATRKDTVRDGLVGHWTFDGQDSNGIKTFDLSGKGNHGTLTNGPARTVGKIGQAMSFDGVDDNIALGNLTTYDNLAALTLSVWAYPTAAGCGTFIANSAAGCGQGGADTGWFFSKDENLDADETKVSFSVDYGTANLFALSAANTLTTNEWQHFLVTWDGSASASGVTIYKNGVAVSTSNTVNGTGGRIDDSSANFRMGNSGDLLSPFNGALDDVRIYNRVLTADEIKRLYNMGR